jgi:capsular exopolysaccharide synthesis family protein
MNMIDTSFPHEPTPLPPVQAGGLDIKFLLRRLTRGLPIIVALSVAGGFGGYALMKKLPAKYTTSTSILIDPKRPGSYGADTDFANVYIDNSKVSSVELVLQSTTLLKAVVDKLHLADNPLYGAPASNPFNSIVYWLSGKKPTVVPDSPDQREQRAIARLLQMIHPARIGITYVIRVDVTAPNARDAARIANTLADTYVEDLVESKLDATKRDAAWLADRMKTQRQDLIKSEVDVASIQHKFGIVGGDSNAPAVDRQSVTGVNEQLIAAEGEVASAQSRYAEAEAMLKSGGDLARLPEVASSSTMQDLRHRQAEAEQKIADLSTKYSYDHPAVKEANRDLAAINTLISSETARIAGSLKAQYEESLTHKNALTAEMNRLVGLVNATSNAEGRAELREAERIAEANRVAYEASLNKLREVQQQESRPDVEARIISRPDAPDFPSFPRAIQVVPAGMGLGLLAGLALTCLLPLGRPQFDTAIEAERDLDLPVVGVIPFLSKSKLRHQNRTLSVPEYLTVYPFSIFSETIRLLRYRLRSPAQPAGRVIQLTSSVPGEGKSTIAASLAISAATGHVPTVLIDLDLHHPNSGSLLGNDSRVGIVDILLGDSPSDLAVQGHSSLPIAILSAGSVTTLRPGIIESKRLAELIRKLRLEYELVIIDTPPVLSLSDAVMISNLVDSTLLVVACRDTPRSVVAKAVNVLRSSGAPLTGIVLNKVEQSSQATYIDDKYRYKRDYVAQV